MTTANAQRKLAELVDSYDRGWGDWCDEDTPDSLATEYFNADAEVGNAGHVWVGNCWADGDQLVALAEWLDDRGHLSRTEGSKP